MQRQALPDAEALLSEIHYQKLPSVRGTVTTLFHRLHQARMLRQPSGEAFSGPDEAVNSVFTPGFDQDTYIAIRSASVHVPADESKGVAPKPVPITSTDWAKVVPLIDQASKLAMMAAINEGLLQAVFGPLDNTAPLKQSFMAISRRLGQDFNKSPNSILVNYDNPSDLTGAAGAASPGAGAIEISGRAVKGLPGTANAVLSTLVHEAAHETNGAIVDLGYSGSAGFESMTVKDKLNNADHYGEAARRLIGTSAYDDLAFVPKSGVLAGTSARDALAKVAKLANTGLEELWRMSLNLPQVFATLAPDPADDNKARRENQEMIAIIKSAYHLPGPGRAGVLTSVDRSLVETTTLTLVRAIKKLKLLPRVKDPAIIHKYLAIPSAFDLATAIIKKVGGLSPKPVETEERHYALCILYNHFNHKAAYE